MIKQVIKLIKSYWDMDIKPFLKAFFPEKRVTIRDEEEPSNYIEDNIHEEWDVEDDDDDIGYSRERDTSNNVPKPPFVQEENGFV